MAKNIVIIKIGATGDVVRTTVLLHLYKNDNITWITAKHTLSICPRFDNKCCRIDDPAREKNSRSTAGVMQECRRQ